MQSTITTIEELLTDETILHWYFKLDDDNVNKWEDWANQSQANRLLLNEAASFLQTIKFKEVPISEDRVNNAWNDLSDRILSGNNVVATKKVFRLFAYKKWMAVAALLILMIGSYFIFEPRFNRTHIETAYGQISERGLPDGTSIVLNANSHISTNKFQNGKPREVWLKGEAFFKVHKTATKDKFIVHTGKVDIVVTGTQFDVVNRDNKTSVYLKEGSVYLIAEDGSHLNMKPGDYVEIINDKLIPKNASDRNILDWKEKKMMFDSTTMQEVAQRLKDVYGVDVEINEAIKNKVIFGIMPNDDLDVFLKAFEISQDFKVIRNNQTKTITILPKQ
ncbi:MAG: FecR family protein [Bacteroidota bacterium]|nr:FecR family protein [Bacteroidota bacterium]